MAKKKIKKPEEKQKKSKAWIFIAIVIIALVTIFAFTSIKPTENTSGATQGGGQEQGQQTPSTELTEDICKIDLECFLASCKSNPSVIDCVNSTHQEIYYKGCRSYTDVIIDQYTERCACIQGMCKIK